LVKRLVPISVLVHPSLPLCCSPHALSRLKKRAFFFSSDGKTVGIQNNRFSKKTFTVLVANVSPQFSTLCFRLWEHCPRPWPLGATYHDLSSLKGSYYHYLSGCLFLKKWFCFRDEVVRLGSLGLKGFGAGLILGGKASKHRPDFDLVRKAPISDGLCIPTVVCDKQGGALEYSLRRKTTGARGMDWENVRWKGV